MTRTQPTTEPTPTTQAHEVRRVTVWGMVANLGLSVLKAIAGILGGSQALVADAVHSLSDTSTDIAVLIGVYYWSAPADEEHPHGHGRIETLVSVAIGIALATVGAGLIYRALVSLNDPPEVVPGWLAFAAACASIIGKEALYRWTANVGKRVKSSAVVANAWHHRSDALSSVPVAVAVVGIHVRPDWVYLDNIATVVVSSLIFHAAWRIAWPGLHQLLDRGADEATRQQLLTLARETDGVMAVHALRSRNIGPGFQVDLHVLVKPDLTVQEGHDIAGAVKARMIDQVPDVVDVLVHIEPYIQD